MVNLKKLCVGALLATTICGMGALTPSAEAGKIEDVQARGILLVGSTGDYKPMSYLNKETGKYEGFDVEVAELLAQSLGVKVQYVPTTWKTLQLIQWPESLTLLCAVLQEPLPVNKK